MVYTWSQNYKHCRFRIDPVPGTHHRKAGGRFFRSFRHKQAKAIAAHAILDGIKIRSKRSLGNITDPRDDYVCSDWRDRSWKRHRRHQYKEGKC